MDKDNGREDAIRASLCAVSAVSCLRPGGNPWAAVGYLLDAQRKVTHVLDALTELLGEQDPDRLDRIYLAHRGS